MLDEAKKKAASPARRIGQGDFTIVTKGNALVKAELIQRDKLAGASGPKNGAKSSGYCIIRSGLGAG